MLSACGATLPLVHIPTLSLTIQRLAGPDIVSNPPRHANWSSVLFNRLLVSFTSTHLLMIPFAARHDG